MSEMNRVGDRFWLRGVAFCLVLLTAAFLGGTAVQATVAPACVSDVCEEDASSLVATPESGNPARFCHPGTVFLRWNSLPYSLLLVAEIFRPPIV
jgi:hypothetical protein